MIEQDEFNASAFWTNKKLTPINEECKNLVEIMHKVFTVYFYSLAQYIMNYLAGIK